MKPLKKTRKIYQRIMNLEESLKRAEIRASLHPDREQDLSYQLNHQTLKELIEEYQIACALTIRDLSDHPDPDVVAVGIAYACDGLTAREIADEFYMSERNVYNFIDEAEAYLQ